LRSPVKELQPLTGYVRGGVTVLGAKKAYPVYVDETIELFQLVSISAGMRGLQILLAPAEYLRATAARLGPIAALE
jgi:Cys-tRNA(Pro)/Cys-tRNA(Cys) deacylase